MDLLGYILISAAFGFFFGWEMGHSRGFSRGQDQGYSLCRNSFDNLIKLGSETEEKQHAEEWGNIFADKYKSFDDWYRDYISGFMAMCPDSENKNVADFDTKTLMAEYTKQKNPRALGATHAAKLIIDKSGK